MWIDNQQYAVISNMYDELGKMMTALGGIDWCEAEHPELHAAHFNLYCALAGKGITPAEEMTRRGIDEQFIKRTIAQGKREEAEEIMKEHQKQVDLDSFD